MTQRCKFIKRSGKRRAYFECPEGHRFLRVMVPGLLRGSHISEDALATPASQWTKTDVTTECPKCRRAITRPRRPPRAPLV
jgi:hypothetical protein